MGLNRASRGKAMQPNRVAGGGAQPLSRPLKLTSESLIFLAAG